ncbi:Serine/threonine pseudokinase [Gracilaria domingensis]|nr:Serine/threonine pseudokinase [Gracilaria domingensis]
MQPAAAASSSLADVDRQQSADAASSRAGHDNSLPDLRGVVPPFLRRLSSPRPAAQTQSAADDANSVPFFAPHPDDAGLQLPDILTQTVVTGSSIPFFANSPYGNNTPTTPRSQRQSTPRVAQSPSAAAPPRPYTPQSRPSQPSTPSSQPSERVRRPSPPNGVPRLRRHSPPNLPKLPRAPTSHRVSDDAPQHSAAPSRAHPPPAPQLPELPITPVSPRTPHASASSHPVEEHDSPEPSEERQLLPGENIRIDSVKSWGTFGELQNSLSQTVLESSVELGERDAPVIDPAHLQVDFSDAENRIGIGTYGSVYVGCYHGELVAVKRIRMPEVSSAMKNDANLEARQKEAMRQFAREIRRYERVSHPGVVHFLGVTVREQEGTALIVTALMRGGSLGEALKNLRRERTPLDPSTLVRIALQTCGGLRALHSANFTWGDAKPDNILLSAPLETGGTLPVLAQARISDFGLSRSVGQSLLTDTTVAGSGEPAGTFNYMAPEAFAGVDPKKEDIAKASDVFSYGMVLYEMLTLRTPWRRHQMFDVYAALMKGERPEWPKETDEDFFQEVPLVLRKLVESCWAQSPLDRPTADELFRKLDEASFSLNIREGQRPVSDITNPAGSDINIGRTPGMIHSLSKRSSTSTAVAICEDSVDLSDSALESSGESATFDESENELVSSDSNLAMDYANGNPRVSPVSSLETKPLDGLEGSNRTNPQFQDAQTPQGSFKATQGRITQANFVAVDSEVKIQPEKIDTESKMSSAPRPEATPTAEEEIFENFVQEDLHAVPTTDFIQYRDQIAQHFAEAAFHLSNIDDSEPLSNEMKYVTEQRASPEGNEAEEANMEDSVEGKTEDSNAVNPSPATLRRKRSKRLQNIIEHAALAFLELQRREDRVQKTPPKIRKEAAERKAEEEARQLSEHETLRIIDNAQSNGDYTAILERVQNNRKSHVIVKAGCSFLEVFCRSENLYFDLCEEGVVEEYISAASLFGKQDAVLCTVFCNSMTSLSKHFDDKVGHLIRGVGVPSMVIEVLEYHKTDIPLQIAGCHCLGAIAASSELSRSAVATLGGPGAVYRAITKNNSSFKDVELARASLKAIRHIALDNEKAAEYLVEVAALDPVSRAAEVFTDHGLEQDILDALQAFSFYNGGRRNIIMSSGLKALTAIMLRNRDPRFLVQCCIFVRSIARWRDRDCEDAMLQSSISERVTSLMRTSNDIPGEEGARVAWYACNACTFLASFGSRSRKRLRRVGAIETVLDLLPKRRENRRVVHSATDAVAELIKNEPESRAVAENYNVIPILTDVLELHKEEDKVKNAVLWTLHYLASPNEGPFGPAPGSQAHQEVIRKLMLRYGQKPAVQTNQKRRIFRFGWKRNERGKAPS